MRTWTPIALILSAAAGAPLLAAERGPVKSLLEMRQDRVVVQKWDLSCGAAALATLLNYQHGDPVPEREIAKALIQRKEYLANPLLVQAQQGFSLLDLKRYVDQRGYEGIGYGRLTLQDLIEQAPIMVPAKPARLQSLCRVPRQARGSGTDCGSRLGEPYPAGREIRGGLD